MGFKSDKIISLMKKRYIYYKDIPRNDIKKIKRRYSLRIIDKFLNEELKNYV